MFRLPDLVAQGAREEVTRSPLRMSRLVEVVCPEKDRRVGTSEGAAEVLSPEDPGGCPLI